MKSTVSQSFLQTTKRVSALALLLFVSSACSKLIPAKPTAAVAATYQVAIASGNAQSGSAGNSLPYAFVATVTDQNGAVASGVTVNWSVASGAGNLNDVYATSARDGTVTANLTLGATVGANSATVTVPGNSGPSVTFTAMGVAGGISALHTTITGSSPVENDGINSSIITITLKDANNNAIAGTVPTFTATGSSNTFGACSASNASGVSTCTLKSTTAETKVLSITNPTIIGGTVVFSPGSVVAANSSISATGPVTANGSSTSTVTITLKDSSNVGVAGIVPTFSATDTGSTNAYGTCSLSTASGVSTCTLTSTVAEVKTVSITSPVSVTGGTVTFVHGPVSSTHSTITGTGPVEPDGTSSSTISISLKDANNNSISAVVPTFSATDTGSNNSYGTCSSSDASGLSTCTLSSGTAETKTLSLLTPGSFSGGSVVFAPSAVVAANSSISGSTPVVADGTSVSTITITLKDSNHVAVGGIVPTFTATNTVSGNHYGTCSSSSATTGISTCTLSSTTAETKTLSLASPVTLAGGTVVFTPGPVSQATTTLTGTGPIVADGSTASTLTIKLLDANNNAISGTVPTFSATDTGSTNHYGVCSSSDATGSSTCTLASTKAELKTLELVSPGAITGSTVSFIAGNPAISMSSITGTGPVSPDGTSTSTITITLIDTYGNPVDGEVPTFSATNTGNTNSESVCSSSSTTGISTCTLSSTTPETKTLSLLTPIAMTGGTVLFTPGSASSLYSTITATGPVTADGSSESTVTITLKDGNQIPIPGTVPTFSATNSGNTNVYGACSSTNSSGVATCSLSSTRAEVKTLSFVSPVNVAGGTVTFTAGTISGTNCQITGSGPVAADGTSSSTVIIVLYDANNNPIAGSVPSFGATDTGSTNVYGTCSSSSATGASTCTLKSTKAEVKTLEITSPVLHSGGNVSFTALASNAANSTITGSGPVAADGTSSSTVTITLMDVNNNAVSGVVPTFTATNTGNTNVYGTCATSNVSGVSTCTLKSTHSEVKTLSIATPVVKAGGTVTFSAATASATTSSIVGTSPVNADGSSTSTITITLKDVNSNAVVGTVPTFTVSGSNNALGTCSATSSSGVSTCTLSSTTGETKVLSLATPIIFTGGSVVFTPLASTTNSTITGSGPVVANGTSTSTITITLKDYANNAIVGTIPTFTATDTAATNAYTTCSTTNSSGVSTCTLKSAHAETKTLSLSSPVTFTGGTVSFVAGAASSSTTTITGTTPTNADGASASTITITLLDANSNPVAATVPTFSATNTGTTNGYGACSSSSASGVSTCTLISSHAETKTLSLLTPVAMTGGTVVFSQVPYPANCSITGTASTVANGTSGATITITLKDYSDTAIAGVTPTFSATDTGNTNIYGACSVTSASGVSTCTLKSSEAESKILSLTAPVSITGSTITFTQAASATYSSIIGTSPVNADGTSASSVTITLKDYANTAIVGIVPTFSATNTGTTNTYGTCSSSNASGVSTCTLKSTHGETKVLSLLTPVAMTGGSVVFNQVVSSTYTTITGSGPVAANGTATSTITITLKDSSNTAVVGMVPTFIATDSGSNNGFGTSSSSNSSGVSTCTLKSTTAETKTLNLTAPISMTGGTVVFSSAASASYSTITGTSPVNADGTSTSTITITLKDYTNTAVVGMVPTFTATNTGTTNVYGTCSSSNTSGVSTCTLASQKAEVKTLSLATPVVVTGSTVTFNQATSAGNSTITGTGPVIANGTAASTITITLKDYSNTAIVGTIPTFVATDTGSNNVYGSCSSSSSSGVSTCTLKSTTGEVKTLTLSSPVSVTGGAVTFTQTASPSYTTITGSGSVPADGSSTSTITITLKDYNNSAMVGTTPTFTATNTGTTNAYGTCSSSNASGVSTCTLASTKAETKTLTLATPISLTGGTVVFTQAASAANSTITGTGPVTANGTSSSTVTIVLKDYYGTAIVGTVPTFSATNSGSNNVYGTCSATSASGSSTCTFKSHTAETKTLSIVSPVSVTGGTVTFD
jgi:adhesin/invasin